MIFLYFLLDIVLYNYTSCKTLLYLVAIIEKQEKKYVPILTAMLFDYLLAMQGKLAIHFTILFFINQKIKITSHTLKKRIIHFCLLVVMDLLFVFILYHQWIGNLCGIVVTLFFVLFSYKKPSYS